MLHLCHLQQVARDVRQVPGRLCLGRGAPGGPGELPAAGGGAGLGAGEGLGAGALALGGGEV